MINNNIICINKNIDENLHNEIINLNIQTKKRINVIGDLIIKYMNEEEDDMELYIINKYLSKEFESIHFFNYYAIIKINNGDGVGIVMPIYDTLKKYLGNNKITPKMLLDNILLLININIFMKDKYKLIHGDIKVCNILINNDVFYLIDWEKVLLIEEMYYNSRRPTTGNTEMYPHYDATSEQFFIYSIGVLIMRIVGFNYEVTHEDFIHNYHIEYILSKIPMRTICVYETLIFNIIDRKFNKIEELRDNIINIINTII
jgi:serine/threonine protein kinase